MASALEKSLKARQGSTQSLASASIKTNTATGGSALAKSIATRSAQTTPTLNTTANIYASDAEKKRQEEEKNKGGPLGGIGYVGEKAGLGVVQTLEGAFDYIGAGILDFFGADDAAEDILENDWVNYSHADEWFNPGEGWKVAGDVAGGIGTTLAGVGVGMAVSAIPGAAVLAPKIALGTMALGAAGSSTKEAYQESGELGFKEFGYGAIMGGVELATEALSGALGAGVTKAIGSFTKTASKTATAITRKSIIKQLGMEFASEAFEEGFAELVSPIAKRITYDPDAEFATPEEVAYAAFVGGLSGLFMGGGRIGITEAGHRIEGGSAVKEGKTKSIMDTAKAFSDYEGTSPTKLSSMEAIRDLYTRLDAQGVRESTELTGEQKRAIGELRDLTTYAVFEPAMRKSVISAIEGAEVIAQKLNADGQIKIVDGKMQAVTAESLAELQKQGVEVRDITADDIRGGVDVKDGKSVAKAMKENDLLRYIAASDVAGRFMMTAKEVETAARAGTKIRSQAELNNYIEKATPEMKAALGAELGIADNEWDTLKLQRFNEAAAAYRESGKLDAKRAEMKAQKEKASEEAKRMSMDSVGETTAKPTNEKVAALKEKLDAKKIDSYVAENIEGYSSLGEANKSMIRQIVREGRATGISEADILSYARVAEHTGLNVEFDANMKDGEAGYYDPKGNKIVVNPKTTKKHELILIHELDHALRKFVAGDKVHTIVYDNADKRLSQETRDMIEKEYSDQDTDVSREELFADEASAYYSEAILGGKGTVDMLLGKEPSLAKKILNFFTDAARAYSGDEKLSKEARRHYRNFKKMFDAFSEFNKGRNAETAVERTGDGKAQRKTYASINAETADKMQLSNARQMLENGASSEEVREATGWFRGYDGKWRFEIDDSDMEYSRHGFNPDYLRYKELELKFLEGTISDSELQELQNTPQDIKNINLHRLDQFVKHEALFAAYPELKRVRVSFDPNINANGVFYPETFSIKINPNADDVKKTLLHEIQHAIQYTEGLTGGTDVKDVPPDVKNRVYVLKEEQKKISQELEVIYKEIGFDKYSESLWEKAWNMEIDPDTIESLEEQFLADKSRKGLALYNYQKQVIEMVKEAMREEVAPYENYRNTAGEIEARDVANRANLTAEERKNTRPDIDRGDVVFAEDSLVSKDFAGWTIDGNEVYYTSATTMSMSDANRKIKFFNDFVNAFRGRTAKFERNGHTHYARFGETKSELGKLVYEGNDPASKSSAAGYKAKIRLLADGSIFELVEDSVYDDTEPETGKNKKSHKNAKHWDYYIKTIVVDGKAYDVLVNVRNDVVQNDYSTKEEYVYSIRFRDNKKATTSLVHPATSKATSQLDVVVNTSISQNGEKSTDSAKKVSESARKSTSHEATLDSDYLAAVNRGDMKTAQRMVDEAAKKAGYTVKAYHGTPNMEFTVFDKSRVGKGNDQYGAGFYFATDKEAASHYGNRVINAVLSINKPIKMTANTDVNNLIQAEILLTSKQAYEVVKRLPDIYDAEESPLGDYFDTYWEDGAQDWMIRELAEQYRDVGLLDSDLFRNYPNELHEALHDVVGYDGVEVTFEKTREKFYVAWFDNQMKSADPVTYDDDGNVIPLSERFNPKNSDIRYSMDITPEIEAARGSIVMDLSSYKPKGRKETIEYGKAVGDDAYTRFQIQATNQQAGLEKELKRLGVKNGEALVQSARSASNAAATMIGDMQMRIGDGSYEVQGEGLEKIYHPILNGDAIESELKGLSKKEREARLEEYSSDFFAYLFHMHSADRMSLEQRSIDENNERIKTLDKKVKRRTEVEAEIKSKGDAIDEIASSRTKENNAKRKELRDEWRKLRAEKAQLDRDIKNLMKEVAEFVPAENKPVLGHVVDADGKTVLTTADGEAIPYTAEESKAIAEEILKLHPEFKEAAEKVWAYNKNLNQYRVDAGLISQESFDRMQELYPHYVPTYREGSRTGIAAMSGKYALKVKATVKSAKGGLRPLCRPDVIMARQTEETIKAGRVNQLARTYYDAAEPEIENGVNAIRVISRVDAKADETIDFDPTTIAPKNNRVTFYKNGEKIEMEVDKNVFDGFDAFNSQTDMGGIITGVFGKVMNLYKRLITSYSPIFTIRNAIRDLQDAGINTKYGKTFLRNYKRAMKEIRSNGKYWQMYRAAGGLSSSLFDFERGFGGSTNSWGLTKAEGTPWQKLGTTIENANVFIEQLPRLAEFISSMEANNSIEQAILDAADVTTNFGRSGKMARWLNRNFIPFLNPSIQGFSKLVRNVTDRKTAKELVAFLLKAALLGFAPQIINQLFLGDDDEYEKLRDSDKENNYIIRIPGREEFIKIPKGRVVAAMSGIVNRTANTLQGKEDAWDGYLDSVLQNITPVDSASRDILSPFRDVKANKTWYGTEIEGRQFENVPVEERTDEGTSWIAEVLAQLPTSKAAELSPKKIHYLIDQYTGIIGDVVLPATSKKAQKDMLSGAFVIDPVLSNDLSNRFYNQYDKAVQTKNSTKSTEEELEIASFRYKYLGKIKDTVSDMQKAKREVQASDLKATEKLKQTREIQAAINLLYEEALNDIDKLTELYNGTYYLGAADIYSNYVASGITDEQYASLRYAETIRSYYGAETALSQYNSAVYEKATLFNKAGLDYDTYYEYYFSTRGIESDVDKKGEVVSGSKKKKTLAAIKALGVSQTERLLLTAAAGYSLTESEKKRLISYINKLAVTKDEKIAIAEACGFTVKNGRISLK